MNDKTRPKVMQLKMPEFAQSIPINWAIRNQWSTEAHKPGTPNGPRPHTSLAVSACIVGVDMLPYHEQQRILLAGMRRIMAHEETLSNREKMRLCRSNAIRPAGAARAS